MKKKIFFTIIILSNCILSSCNQQYKSESNIYTTGKKIAEGVGTSFAYGSLIIDPELDYKIITKNNKIGKQPVINVELAIKSTILRNPKYTFLLFLEQKNTPKLIVGTVKQMKVDGHSTPSTNIMNNTMYIETKEGTEQVKLLNGNFYFAESGKPVISNANETTPNIKLSNLPTDFVTFINKFASNKTFQIEHIRFPLSSFDLNVLTPTKDKWEFIDADNFFEGTRRNKYDLEIVGHFEKQGNNKINYTLGPPESEIIYNMTFERLNQNWYLVEYLDYSMFADDY